MKILTWISNSKLSKILWFLVFYGVGVGIYGVMTLLLHALVGWLM